jgi:integrase/recombinase XerD
MNEILLKYKEYLLARNRSLTYFNYIRIFLSYLEKKSIDINNITQQVITDFLNDGQKQAIGKAYSANAKNGFIKAGKDFYINFLQNKESEWTKIKCVRPEKRLRKFFRIEDLEKGIKYLASNDTGLIDARKMDAILSFLFHTGLSKAEFLNLKRSDIDLLSDPCSVRVFRTKTNKERMVYFSEKYSPRLKQKLQIYFDIEKEEKNAFNISQEQLEYLVKKFGDYIGMKVTPHMLRHSYATYLLRKTGNLKLVQQILGHSNIATTAIYTELDEQEKQNYFV